MGKHNYIVSHKSRSYFHETSVSFRRDPIPIVTMSRTNAVVMDRNANVFKLWHKDSPEQLAKAYDLDVGYQKISVVLKQPADQEDVREFLIAHFEYIRDTFLTLVINCGNFPYLNLQDVTRFMKQCDVFDSFLTASQLDYLMANVKAKLKAIDASKISGQQPNDLNRAEFIELIVRVAIFKYKENAPKGVIITMVECVEKLVIDCFKPNFDPAPWQVFREEELWTRHVNLVYYDNEVGLKKLFASYANQSLNKIPYANSIKLLTQDCSIKLDRFDAIYCYGMSLTTCIDLHKATNHKLLHQSYEEFLEMIARASDLHFVGSDQEGLELWQKIMLILDELLLLVEDCSAVMPKWTEEEESENSEPQTPKIGL